LFRCFCFAIKKKLYFFICGQGCLEIAWSRIQSRENVHGRYPRLVPPSAFFNLFSYQHAHKLESIRHKPTDKHMRISSSLFQPFFMETPFENFEISMWNKNSYNTYVKTNYSNLRGYSTYVAYILLIFGLMSCGMASWEEES
jgi:hypothetical protein